MAHKLFTADIVRQLKLNGKKSKSRENANLAEPDHVPVVKIFNPYSAATWLFTEIDPDDNDRLFGLCDTGQDSPRLDYASRKELEALRIHPRMSVKHTNGEIVNGHTKIGVPLERDRWFSTEYPLTVWLEAAQREGRYTEDETALAQADTKLDRSERKYQPTNQPMEQS